MSIRLTNDWADYITHGYNAEMDTTHYQHYGQRIKDLRVDRGWSQRKFAERTGLQRSNLTNYETGNQSVGAHIIVRIANRLRLNLVDELRIGGFWE